MLSVAETSLLLLSAAPSFFAPLWDWSPLLRLLHWAPAPGAQHPRPKGKLGEKGGGKEGGSSEEGALDEEELVQAVRWTALEVHCAVSRMSPSLKAHVAAAVCGLDAVSSFKCFLR